MAHTTIADLVVNVPYLLKYIQQYTTQNSAFVRSGIVAADPNIAKVVNDAGASGKQVNLPFFNDLAGDDEEMTDDGSALTPAAITASQDVAVINRRAKAFGAADLAGALTANNPYEAIAALIGDYRLRQRQKTLFAVLKGIFADNVAHDDSDLVMDISGETGEAAILGQYTLLDAAQLLGDAKEKLTGLAMHSAAETALNKLSGSSQTYRPAADNPSRLPSYNGKSIIMDDSCAYDPDTKVAEIILFGQGAVAMNDAQGEEPALEPYRDPLKSVSGLVSRDFYTCHVRGIKWTGASFDGATPTRTELGTAANWDRVYDKKNIRVAKLICKLA